MSEVKRFNPAEYLPGMFPHESGNYVRFSSFGRMKQDRDAQRLRADTAEAELAKLNDLHNAIAQGGKLVADRLAAAEQRIANHESTLRHFANCADVRQVGTAAMAYVAALNPSLEAESHE